MIEGVLQVAPALPGAVRGGGVWPSPVDGLTGDLLYRWWLDTRPGWTDPGWYDAPLRPGVRALLGLPLGPGLLVALSRLDTSGAGRHVGCPGDHRGAGLPGQPVLGSAPGFPCVCQVVVATAWEAMASWTAARSAAELVAVAGAGPVVVGPRGAAPGITDMAVEELAPALRLSPTSVRMRITAARDLHRHPTLRDLVADGGCSFWAARGVLDVVTNLPDEQAEQVIAEVTEKVRERNRSGRRCWTATEVRRTARVTRLRVGGPADDAARNTAKQGRRVTVSPAGDGMAALVAVLAEVDAHRIHARLTALAVGLDDPQRSRDQKRADILTDVLLAAGTPTTHTTSTSTSTSVFITDPAAARPAAIGQPTPAARPEVSVVVSLATLLGLSQEPGELLGLGPIPADAARELAADGVWRAWITDTNGQVIATSTRRYTPSPALARLIRAREPHCRYPGCRRRTTDLDHTIPWGHPDSTTSAQNLGALCRRHHILKTHHQHQLTNHPDSGGWSWTTPAGVQHDDGPEQPLP